LINIVRYIRTLPRYGNWGGQDWSGGQSPSEHNGEDGTAPPVDSSDELYKIHDERYRAIDEADYLGKSEIEIIRQKNDLRKEADRLLANGLLELDINPRLWSNPPTTEEGVWSCPR
jgi:hypothetical protein